MSSDTQQYNNRFKTVSKLIPDLREIEARHYIPFAITVTFKQPDRGWSIEGIEGRTRAVYLLAPM